MVKINRMCRHDQGFYLCTSANSPYPGAWYCNHLCGYSLNFDPCKYPDGVSYTTSPKVDKPQSLMDRDESGKLKGRF